MKKCVKVPTIIQMEHTECGAASLAMVLAYYGCFTTLEQLRIQCGVSRDGANAKNILRAAKSYGLETSAFQCEIEDLKNGVEFPCILHWEFSHFVVLCGFRRGKAVIADPDRGLITVAMEELDKSFTGVCLCFEPGECFQKKGGRNSLIRFAGKRVRAETGVCFLIALACLAAAILEAVRPVFSRVFLDDILEMGNERWLYPLIFAVVFAALLQFLANGVQKIYWKKAEGKLAVTASAEYMWHVLRLPMEFFSQRFPGDLGERQQENQSIAYVLLHLAAPAAVNLALLACYLVLMAGYSPALTLVGITAFAVNFILSMYSSSKRMQIARLQLRDMGKLRSAELSGIEMIETVKASGVEHGFFCKWAGRQAAVNESEISKIKVEQYAKSLSVLVSSLANGAVLSIGSFMILKGRFTLGMLIAFQGLLAGFLYPAEQILFAGQKIQEMRTHMERIQDIMNARTEASWDSKEETARQDKEEGMDRLAGKKETAGQDKEEETARLEGSVEIKNVTFGYSRLAEPLITEFSLRVEPGEKVAIVGESGCGKSTLLKLISGLYEPWTGSISLGGKPLKEISRETLAGSLAAVDQNIVMFEDTIGNNIKMWDASIEDYEMILAARDAQIHEEIMEKENGYHAMVSQGGRNLSGGQRQRIEIARALAQDPGILLMDEATCALDAQTEAKVVHAIAERGITCVIAAHRLSAIQGCDRIIVMQKGKIAEQGTHEELYKKNGCYRRIVSVE